MFDFSKTSTIQFVSRRIAIITSHGKNDIADDGKIGSSFDELVIKHFCVSGVCVIVIA